MPDLRFPIGEFALPKDRSAEQRIQWIADIEDLPPKLRDAVTGLSDKQLDTPYRPDGWTIRQVVHHLPDSHINSYVRLKLALTEDNPTIQTYFEDRWGELRDSTAAPPELSLALLEALHRRWVFIFRAMTEEDFKRTFNQPEMGKIRLDVLLAFYSWHGRHHLAHITTLCEREDW